MDRLSIPPPSYSSPIVTTRKKLGKVEISLIVVFSIVFLGIVLTIILVLVLPKTVVNSSGSGQNGSGGGSSLTRTVFLTAQNLVGNSAMPTKISSPQFSSFNAPVTWQTTNPNNLLWIVTNATHQAYFTLTSTEYSNLSNPDFTGQIVVNNGANLATSQLNFGVLGLGFDPSDVKPLDPRIPVSGMFDVPSVSASGTVTKTIPTLPLATSNYMVFAQNCSGDAHQLLAAGTGTLTSESNVQITYFHEPPGTIQTGVAKFGFFIVKKKPVVDFGESVIWGDAITVSSSQSGTRVEQLTLPVSIDNTLGDNVWFGFPTTANTVIAVVRQTTSSSLELFLNSPTNWTANFVCFKGGVLQDQFFIGP